MVQHRLHERIRKRRQRQHQSADYPVDRQRRSRGRHQPARRWAAVGDETELARLHAEIEDRFGPAPDAVLSLLSIAEIRVACRRLAISSLKERKGVVTIEFARIGHVSAERVVRLIGESGGTVMLDKDRPNCLLLKTGGIDLREKSEFISEKLNALA
ncbi:MAG: hypothetical protein OXJ90_27250 [Spirochaetaceae bacterium]|nr:hypothetical protein [Spirochaetaceae bacterium]